MTEPMANDHDRAVRTTVWYQVLAFDEATGTFKSPKVPCRIPGKEGEMVELKPGPYDTPERAINDMEWYAQAANCKITFVVMPVYTAHG